MYRNTIEQQGFRLIQQIESTLQTEVWKAQQVTLDRTVCLQILKPELACEGVERERFLAMARCFAKLKSESIASVFDVVSDGDLHYVVMELVDGPTLEEALAQSSPFPLKQILQIASSLAFGFEQLWESARVVHRNLKGATVRLDPRGVAKITDFSLAFVAKPGVDMVALDGGHVVGAPSFISPEYAQGQTALTTQSDMYAFGALLYMLATGHAPFGTLSAGDVLECQVRSQIAPPHLLNSRVPVAFSWFIHRLMMKNPLNRYGDWRAVRYDIKCLLNDLEPRCVRPEEAFLSTILEQPMLDAMAAEAAAEEEQENESNTRKSIRLKQTGRHNPHWEEVHRRDIAHHNARMAFFMSLLLLTWFALLFWYRGVWQPSRQAQEAEAPLVTEEVAPPEEAVVVVDEVPPPPPPIVPTVVTPPPVAVKVTPVVTNTPPPVEKVVEMPKALRDVLVAAFKVGDLVAAKKSFADDETPFTMRDVVREVIDSAPSVEAMIEAGARAKIGRALSVNWKGKARNMIPRSIANGIIAVEVNGRTHEIVIKELSPDEKLEFVAAPKSEGEHLTYCLMLLDSSRPNDVTKFAEKCPAVKDLVLRAMGR